MAYAAWSVTFGEQPTASKWNILGTNDAAFNDGTGIAAAAIVGTHFDTNLAGGWITANETWTYASASTFTISGDKTTKYTVGMRLKLTQTTVKYFTITAISYSAPNTTVTVDGGGDYTVANAAITANFYSWGRSPVGCGGLLTLGYAQSTSDFTSTTTPGDVDITGLSIAVNVPNGARRIKITVFAQYMSTSAAAGVNVSLKIKEGATTLQHSLITCTGAYYALAACCIASLIPTAGAHTYKATLAQTAAGTMTFKGNATYPAFILVECEV